MIALALIGAISLTACGSNSPEVLVRTVVEPQFEPEEFQHCADEPTIPARGDTEADARDYVADLRAAYKDCKSKVNGGAEWQSQRRKEFNTQSGQ